MPSMNSGTSPAAKAYSTGSPEPGTPWQRPVRTRLPPGPGTPRGVPEQPGTVGANPAHRRNGSRGEGGRFAVCVPPRYRPRHRPACSIEQPTVQRRQQPGPAGKSGHFTYLRAEPGFYHSRPLRLQPPLLQYLPRQAEAQIAGDRTPLRADDQVLRVADLPSL